MKTRVRSCIIKLCKQKSFQCIFESISAVSRTDIMRQLIPRLKDGYLESSLTKQ